MEAYYIAFNTNQKVEFFSTIETKKEGDYYIILPSPAYDQPIGTFLLDFLNLDLSNSEDYKEFFLKHIFVKSLLKGNYLGKSDLERQELFLHPFTIPHKVFDSILETSMKKELTKLKKLQSDFSDMIEHMFLNILQSLKKPKETKEKYLNEDIDLSNSYEIEIYISNDFYSRNLRVDFYFENECILIINGEEYNAIVPFSFASNEISNILYISLRTLLHMPNVIIQKCGYCNKYFIPNTLRYSKYCDRIIKDGKTCKELGANETYKQSLESDLIIKKYRKRYLSLASSCSTYPDNIAFKERFEKYKIDGAKMKDQYLNNKITSTEFESWIESTKVRKNATK